MTLSDPIALFMVPYALTMFNHVWDLLNESGVIMIPFVVLMISEAAIAKKGGADEGSAPIQALKNIEVKGYGMFLVLTLFLQPIYGTPDFKYAQYSCIDSPSIIDHVKTVQDVRPNNGLPFGQHSPSIGLGMVHEISTGLNGVAITYLPCKKGATRKDVNDILEKSFPSTEILFNSIRDFNAQCYIRGRSAIETELARGAKMIVNPTGDPLSKRFNSVTMHSVYSGVFATIPSKGNVRSGTLSMTPTDGWIKSSQSGKNTNCDDASDSLYDRIVLEIKSDVNYEEDLDKIKSYYNLYGTYSESDIIQDWSNLVYMNVATASAGNKPFKEALAQINRSGYGGHPLNGETKNSSDTISEQGLAAIGMEMFNEVFLFLGSGITAVEENLKADLAVLALPMIASIVQAAIIIFLPFYIIISGFSFQAIYQILGLYFAFAMLPFFVNLGSLFDTLIQSYSAVKASAESVDPSYLTTEGIGAMMVYTVSILWVFFIQMATATSGSAIMSMMVGGMAAAQKAMAMGKQGAKEAQKGVGKGNDDESKNIPPPNKNGA